MLQDDVIQ